MNATMVSYCILKLNNSSSRIGKNHAALIQGNSNTGNHLYCHIRVSDIFPTWIAHDVFILFANHWLKSNQQQERLHVLSNWICKETTCYRPSCCNKITTVCEDKCIYPSEVILQSALNNIPIFNYICNCTQKRIKIVNLCNKWRTSLLSTNLTTPTWSNSRQSLW